MPNSNEEPAAGEAASAPVSIPDDSVSTVNEQLETVKLSDKDEADATASDTSPKEDPELWKPHPPTEECPVCLVPLPLENDKSIYWSCCGKSVCKACCEEHKRALRVTNRKRDKKEQPPLKQTCAFCRSPLHKNDSELVKRYEKRIDKGDARAMTNLAGKYEKGENGLRKNMAKAFQLLQRADDLGSVAAISIRGHWALHPKRPDYTKAKEYFQDAAAKGDHVSRVMLGILLEQEGNIDHAIKHWHFAAAAGSDESMKYLWACFSKGIVSKPDLEKTLRAHKAASDEMNSEDRERLAAYNEALAGNDDLLKNIYICYYNGFFNAKELKKALKALRAGNRGEVETLLGFLNMKTLTARYM